ncbi:MAG TPA: hypothetical protein VIY29_17585 [Ktedonobacteraceae bacterium]
MKRHPPSIMNGRWRAGAVPFIALFRGTYDILTRVKGNTKSSKNCIITAVAPAAHRGAVLGSVVAIFTLPGIIAPLVTGSLIQAAGKNVAVGFHNAYLLTSLLLMMVGVVFLVGVRPDDEQLEEQRRGVVLSRE